MKPIIFAAVLSLLPLAAAQAEMSADDLVNQLKLHPGGPTRGIHALSAPAMPPQAADPSSSRARPTPVAARVTSSPPVAPQAQAQGQASLTVQFANGSDRLTPAAAHTLDTLGKALSSTDLSGDKFRIVGHTDTLGRPETNQSLSERRAQAVVSYIASHYKLDPTRLTAVGVGESEPLVPTGPGVAEPQNRRVQVINLGS